jgi:uncharacterized protein YndB with AHSA1/START domain
MTMANEVALGEQPRSEPADRSVVHATFRIERSYDASPARVFKALSDPAAKAKWFAGGDGYSVLAREMDVRPGGREHVRTQAGRSRNAPGHDGAGRLSRRI